MAQPEDEAGNGIDLSALAWMEEAAGNKLLAYLLGCEVDSLPALSAGETALSAGQISVATEFASLRSQISQQFGDAPAREVLGAVLTQVGADGMSVARSGRLRVTGSEEVPVGEDDIERALISMALDAYPAYLLPAELEPLPMVHLFNPAAVTMMLFRHPKAKLFSDAVLRDTELQQVFSSHNEATGHIATVYRNTGSSSSLQLSVIPSLLLNWAWLHLRTGVSSPESLAQWALEGLRMMRGALTGKPCSINAIIAFAGVLLPEGVKFQVGNGTVRAATEADRQYAPESLKGKLSGTDQDGNTTLINYDGDIILEYKLPYRAKVAPPFEDSLQEFPKDMFVSEELAQAATRLRFSLMLAVERETRAQLVQTWVFFDEPFMGGMSWNDPRRGTGIMPIQLTEAEVATWQEWYGRLTEVPVAKIELALTRILRAIAERVEPSDVLIDSVIAWENLFGTKDGEPTFRVTMCIAKLLADTVEARLALKAKLGKIYALRSRVVHGSGSLKHGEFPMCQEALDVAIRVVKVLVAERIDILKLGDGSSRSAKLLLE